MTGRRVSICTSTTAHAAPSAIGLGSSCRPHCAEPQLIRGAPRACHTRHLQPPRHIVVGVATIGHREILAHHALAQPRDRLLVGAACQAQRAHRHCSRGLTQRHVRGDQIVPAVLRTEQCARINHAVDAPLACTPCRYAIRLTALTDKGLTTSWRPTIAIRRPLGRHITRRVPIPHRCAASRRWASSTVSQSPKHHTSCPSCRRSTGASQICATHGAFAAVNFNHGFIMKYRPPNIGPIPS